MKFPRFTLCRSIPVATLVVCGWANAGIVTYIAEDGSVGDVTNIPGTASSLQRSMFETAIDQTTVRRENFESFNNGDTAVSGLGLFGTALNTSQAIKLTSAPGAVSNVAGDETTVTGRFNTSPGCVVGTKCNWWETDGSFTIQFNRGYSAFAFYGTDFSDFGATVYAELLDINMAVVTSILVSQGGQAATNSLGGSINPTSATNGTGSLLHFGFSDGSGTTYSGVRIRIDQATGANAPRDYMGFDELVLGDALPVTVPEPTTLALVGLSLAGLAAARRRKAAGKA